MSIFQLQYIINLSIKNRINKIISIDETSIYAQIINNYSRYELGKRCVKKKQQIMQFLKNIH